MQFLTQTEYRRIEANNRNLRQAIHTAKSEQTSLREQANECRRKADALLSQEGDAEELAAASAKQSALAKIYDRRADEMSPRIEALPKPEGTARLVFESIEAEGKRILQAREEQLFQLRRSWGWPEDQVKARPITHVWGDSLERHEKALREGTAFLSGLSGWLPGDYIDLLPPGEPDSAASTTTH